MFTMCRPVANMYVKLPNSQLVLVSYISGVCLSHMLILHNALYTPCFSINLISVSKLLKNFPFCLTFHNAYCIIHNTHTKKEIGLAEERQGLYYLVARKINTVNVIESKPIMLQILNFLTLII